MDPLHLASFMNNCSALKFIFVCFEIGVLAYSDE